MFPGKFHSLGTGVSERIRFSRELRAAVIRGSADALYMIKHGIFARKSMANEEGAAQDAVEGSPGHKDCHSLPLLLRILSALAFPSGFEPLTFRLGGGRSILLSYGNIKEKGERRRADSCVHRAGADHDRL